ncbi:MAG: phage portal protein [Candidatus Omnitrophota bacterium]
MFDWLKQKITRRKKIDGYRKAVRAAYYSAASDSQTMDFSFAGSETINDALKADLNTLRQRILYELRQNGPAKGICRNYANACISTGPLISLEVEDAFRGWAEETEFAFSEWAKNCGFIRGESLAELLHVGVRQFFSAGEYFPVDKIDTDAVTPVKYRILLIRADRVTSPYGDLQKIKQGIEFDGNGKPIFYHVKSEDGFEFAKVSANVMRHVFYPEAPDQVRGEPWLAAGLSDLHKRRRYDEARVAAAIVAAKFAVFLSQKDPNLQLDESTILPEGILDLNDGQATVLPPNVGVESFSGAQPVAGATDFRREMIANAGAAMGMSAAAATMDSSGNSFAGARYDDVGVSLEYEVTRSIIENRDLIPVVHKFIREAVAVMQIPAPPEWYRVVVRWPHANRHTDPQKAANANKTRVESGESTYEDIWAEAGRDREKARAALVEEVKWFRENELIHPRDAKAQKAKQEEKKDAQAKPQPASNM